jgi:hypothetical protein
MTYKIIPSMLAPAPSYVLQVETGKLIPFDPDNTDYQQYLKWLEEGNQPLPAEE